MKISVRKNVFETNSSSTHSITLCSADEFERWKKGELLLSDRDKLVTKEEAFEDYKRWKKDATYEEFEEYLEEDHWDYMTYEYWCDEIEYETYEEEYTTKNGDKVIAFGYYGNDY